MNEEQDAAILTPKDTLGPAETIKTQDSQYMSGGQDIVETVQDSEGKTNDEEKTNGAEEKANDEEKMNDEEDEESEGDNDELSSVESEVSSESDMEAKEVTAKRPALPTTKGRAKLRRDAEEIQTILNDK